MKFVRFNPATYWKEKERWIFDNKITNNKQFDVDWDVICELFSEAELHNGHKNAQPMFCFSHFENNLDTNQYILKREQNIVANDVLILDIDNTTIIEKDGVKSIEKTVADEYYPIDRVVDILQEYEWLLYTSFSHSKDWHKYRIILPIDTISKQQQIDRTKGFRNSFYYADPSSFDIGRAFYMPSINPKHHKSFFSYKNSGKQFDWQPVEIVETVTIVKKPIVYTGMNAAEHKGKILWDTLDIVQMFMDVGLYQRDGLGGKHEVLCPWHDEHSSSADTGAAIFTSNEGCGFNCLHGSHRERTLFDVTQYLKDQHGMEWLKQYYEVQPYTNQNTHQLKNEIKKLDDEIDSLIKQKEMIK